MDPGSFYNQNTIRRLQNKFRFLTSAIEAVEQSNAEEIDIVILPPSTVDQQADSDEEEGDDDVLDQDYLPDEVAGELEVHFREEDEEDDVVGNQRPNDGAGTSQRWRNNENLSLNKHQQVASKNAGEEHVGKEAYDIFSLFFTSEMIGHVVMQTNLYANRDSNVQNFTVTEEEMRKFLGLLLISGYHNLPSENDYWSTSEDMEAPIFSKVMSRDRFRTVKRYLHVADNNALQKSKVAKVLPLLDMLRTQCQQFNIFHEFLSIDESMVPYRGHHSAKQFIKSKPVKFGYKLWMLCSANGFPYNFDIYCGKDPSRTTPLGSHVITKMLEPLKNNAQHVVFFDNFFTSHKLLTDLAQRNIRACGTIRENRTGNCPLMDKKVIKKKGRGTYDFKSDGTVLCAKWNDNTPVTVASNYYGVNPVQKVERFVKNEHKKYVDQPFLISMYNKGMGGVDVCDRLLSSYRPRLRNKKWWWNLFAHILNLSVVAAFRFYEHVNPQERISHLKFRSEVARALIKAQTQRKRLGGPTAPPSRSVRYDGINHFLVPCTQGRCVACMKNTRLQCEKCVKRLHKLCTEPYHTK